MTWTEIDTPFIEQRMWTAKRGATLYTIQHDSAFPELGYQVSWRSEWFAEKFDPFPYKSLAEAQESVLERFRGPVYRYSKKAATSR